jgi:hypothetical protein
MSHGFTVAQTMNRDGFHLVKKFPSGHMSLYNARGANSTAALTEKIEQYSSHSPSGDVNKQVAQVEN